LKLFFSNLS